MKRVIAFFMLFYMICYNMAYSEEITNADVIQESVSTIEDYEKAADIMILTGLLQDRDMPGRKVNRAEFATLVGKMTGVPEGTAGGDVYYDVSQADEHGYTVEFMRRNGILSDPGDGYFKPMEGMSKIRAVEMLVAALGYRPKAETQGGYPHGYLAVANELKLLEEIHIDDSTITKEESVVLIYRTMTAPIFKANSYGADVSYVVDYSETLLKQVFSIYVYEGKLTRVGESTLYRDVSKLSAGFAEVSGNKYKISRTCEKAALYWLGVNVECYIQEDPNNDPVIVSLYPIRDIETVELSWDDITDVQVNSGRISLHYQTDNGRTRSVSLASGPAMLLNDYAVMVEPTEFTKPNTGIRILKSDGNSFDIVRLTRFRNMVFDRGDAVNGTVFGIYSNYAYEELDLNANNYTTYLSKNGIEVGHRNISKWNILSIYVDDEDNPTYKKVIITDNSVEGTVTETTIDSVLIDGEEYEYAHSYIESNKVEPAKARFPDVLDSIVVHLDVEGKVAAIDFNSAKGDNQLYGYVIYGNMEQGVEPIVTLKLLDEKSEWGDYVLAKNLKWNGEKSSPTMVFNGAFVDSDDKIARQLIRFKLNSEKGEITEIDTAQVPASEDEALDYYERNVFTLNVPGIDENGNRIRRYYSTRAGSKMLFADGKGEEEVASGEIFPVSNTVVFSAPPVGSDEDTQGDENYYSVGGISNIPFYEWSVLAAYDMDKSARPKVLVHYASTAKVSDVCMVDRLFQSLDEKTGDTLYGMEVMTSKGSVKYYARSQSVMMKTENGKETPFKRGDTVTVLCDLEDTSKRRVVSITQVTADNYTLGEVVGVDGSIIRLRKLNETKSRYYYLINQRAPYYDAESDRIDMRQAASLHKGTVLAFKEYYGGISAYIIVSEPEQ